MGVSHGCRPPSLERLAGTFPIGPVREAFAREAIVA